MFLRGKKDINSGFEEFKKTPGAVLLDVRTRDEYRAAHLPGSVNVPLNRLGDVKDVAGDPDIQIFVYCLSGARAGKAVKRLGRMGYTNCHNIGGINGFRGEVEKG